MLRWGKKEYGLDEVGDNLSGTVKECLEVNKKNYKKLFEQLGLTPFRCLDYNWGSPRSAATLGIELLCLTTFTGGQFPV